jgi:PleD family two-component response regulator
LLPNTDIGRALQIGETVRLAVQALATPHCTSSHQSVSVGVACTRPDGAGEQAVSARLVAGG